MNKPIPDGGRYVKCARCGHQWRLVPEADAEATLEPDTSEYNPDPAAADDASSESAAADDQHEYGQAWAQGADETAAEEHNEASQEPSAWQVQRDQFAASISTPGAPHVTGFEGAEEESPAATAPVKQSWWSRFREGRESPPAEPVAETRKPLFTGRIPSMEREEEQRSPGFSPETNESPAQSDASWTERLRSWQSTAETEANDSEDDADGAEAAIRQALKAALEETREDAQGDAFQRPRFGSEQSGFANQENRWTPDAASTFGSDERGTFGDKGEPEEAEDSGFTGQTYGTGSLQDEEAPFHLTGRNAKTPIFGARDENDDFNEDDNRASANLAFQHDREDIFKAGSLPKMAVEAAAVGRHDEVLTEFDSLYDEQFVAGAAGSEVVDDFEQDAAALQAELESTDIARYDPNRSYGGLATVAAWAVFFSIVSGVGLAFVGLKEDIMAALPGTTGLYRSLGFRVADTGVDFADVNYRWTTSDGKPMIEVTGQVVNITDRTVAVPRVLVNVRDADSLNSVKATASVPTDRLAPRTSTNFTLEFLSPPKNVNQIVLEFDKVR